MRHVHSPRLAYVALIVSVLTALAGCSGSNSDLTDSIAQEKAKKGAPIEPLPALQTFETFEYKDQELRDPFAPSLEEQQQALATTGSGPHPDAHPKEPLEVFPLDSLKMVGTIGTAGKIEGLIKDPDGVIHRVHPRNYLGQNYGKIGGIAEDHIELVELIPNGAGGWMERQASIALGEK